MTIHRTLRYTLHLLVLLLTSTTAIANTEILVIPKGSQSAFWKIVSQGALQAGEDLGIDVIIRGPLREEQHDAQVQIVKYGIKRKFDAIVLAPNHVDITASAVETAVASGTKVVIIDSALHSTHYASFIQSNNYAAGRVAADHIAALLENRGNVILARHLRNNASTNERENGFLDRITSRYPDIKVIADPYIGASVGQAYHTMSDLLEQLSDIDAIFADGEDIALGTLKAMDDWHSPKKIRLIGFDFNAAIKNALISHRMDATIIQDPYQIGYQGVVTAYRLTQNKEVDRNIQTGILLVTPENLHSPEVQKLTTFYNKMGKQAEAGTSDE